MCLKLKMKQNLGIFFFIFRSPHFSNAIQIMRSPFLKLLHSQINSTMVKLQNATPSTRSTESLRKISNTSYIDGVFDLNLTVTTDMATSLSNKINVTILNATVLPPCPDEPPDLCK